jgi:hypothetical protein
MCEPGHARILVYVAPDATPIARDGARSDGELYIPALIEVQIRAGSTR